MRFPKVRFVRWGVAALSGLVLAVGLTGCGGSGPATPVAAADANANTTTSAAPAPITGKAKAKAKVKSGVRVSATPEEDTSHSVRRKNLKEQGR
jgi:multidrug efflux pump subunit AcrA (membrane-fusion protein)